MRITQDLRELAREQAAVEEGLAGKAKEFRALGERSTSRSEVD
jgi:hypothetical protein